MFKKIVTFVGSNPVASAVIALAVGIGAYFIFGKNTAAHPLIAVARGDITEEVIVTGNTKPVANIDLAFQTSGRIASVRADVGAKVTAGQIIATLDASELSAQLAQAQAGVEAAQAKLDALKIGTRPEDIQITQTALDKAAQDLTNDYNDVLTTVNDGYVKSNDAVRNQLSALFANADTNNVQLTFSVADAQTQINVQSERILAGSELNNWKNELVALNAAATNSPATLDQAIKNANAHLVPILAFLSRTMDALTNSLSLSSATLTAYKTSVATAESEATTATTNINAVAQTIASQKIVAKQNRDQLALKLAGSTPEEIRGQEATVAQARANAAVVQAQLNHTVIRSPINGTVTRQDAKVGQIASPNATLISVISIDDLEIDSNVPEVDIGKIAVGDRVDITLDAFSGETFAGKIVKIDPAETVEGGVVNFKVTIDFDKPDPRVKSGLTANLQIETEKKVGVLILPEVAILQNDSGAYVQKSTNGKTTQIPVTLGARDQNGNVEIVSGVAEGDTVLNVGLKTQ